MQSHVRAERSNKGCGQTGSNFLLMKSWTHANEDPEEQGYDSSAESSWSHKDFFLRNDMTKMKRLPLFYSLNRFLEDDERTGVGSVIGNLQSSVNRRSNVPAVEWSIKGRIRVRQRKSRQIGSWIRTDLFLSPTPLTCNRSILARDKVWKRSFSPTLEDSQTIVEDFVLQVGRARKILFLLSLRTIRDANIDILHHMDKSLDAISSPLLFLQEKLSDTVYLSIH